MRHHSSKLHPFVAAMALAVCARPAAAQTDCNANGVPDDGEIGWQVQSVLRAADGAATDQLGAAVAASGDLVVAGAWWQDSNGTDSGSAYVFRRTGQTWSQEAKLVGSDTAAGDYFGYAVAADSATIVVGAMARSEVSNYRGAAYVFEYDGLAWSEQAKLSPPGLQAREHFGTSVAIDGGILVIGARGATTTCDYRGSSGAAYVFHREAAGWALLQKLSASDAYLNDEFGIAVAVSGNTIVVGAHYEGHSGPGGFWQDGPGAAYVFEWNGTTWEETAKLQASNPQTDAFGSDVATTSDVVAIGAQGDSFGGINGAGAVYLFERGSHGWHETARLGASDAGSYDGLGGDIAMQGNTVVANAHVQDAAGVPSMAAYVFTKTELGWVQEAKLLGSGVAWAGPFQGDVALSGETLVLGDTKDNVNGANAGAARVYYGFRNDCNANDLPDDCDIADQTSADCDEDAIPDECQPDCNMNGANDRCDIASLQSGDCNADGVPDECQGDCNANNAPDPCDILTGVSLDCQSDGIPDECQLSGTFQNASGELVPIQFSYPQVHEIIAPPLATGDVTLSFTASADLAWPSQFISVAMNGTPLGNVFVVGANYCPRNANVESLVLPAATFNAIVAGGNVAIQMTASSGVRVELCDRPHITVSTTYVTLNDCNDNGVPDECDISGGASLDCQSNGVPDDCEADCNANGVADACDISGGTSSDCQANAVPDECDIAAGASGDCTGDGVPDECEQDCNGNGTSDLCEVLNDPAKDCDSNGMLDECNLGLTMQTLLADDPAPDEPYAESVALSGDVLVVGSSNADAAWEEAGAAYVYRFDGVQWEFEQKLLPADPTKYAGFGRAVAVQGNAIFVGAHNADGAATASGAAYVFQYAEGAWEQVSRLIACDAEWLDQLGWSIAAEGDVLAVGAHYATGSGDSRGAVYVYERVADEWVETARLVSPNGGSDEQAFGSDVAVSNDTIYVGSVGGFGPNKFGSVYVFRKVGNDWVAVAQLVPPEADYALGFGGTLAVSDGRIFVGAYRENSMGSDAGAVYVFEHEGAEWSPTSKLTPATHSPDALFGISVSVAGTDRIVIASMQTANGDGECIANVFDYEDSRWSLSAQYVGSSAPAPHTHRCVVASLAQTVALGDARYTNGGQDSGAVFVFTDYQNDCNNSGTVDSCDLAAGTSLDCNTDGIPDDCQLTHNDCNQNGVPDECDAPFVCIPTVSEWGLLLMLVVALVAGTLVFAKRKRQLA